MATMNSCSPQGPEGLAMNDHIVGDTSSGLGQVPPLVAMCSSTFALLLSDLCPLHSLRGPDWRIKVQGCGQARQESHKMDVHYL